MALKIYSDCLKIKIGFLYSLINKKLNIVEIIF